MYGIALTTVVIVDIIAFFPQRRKIKFINILLVGFFIYVAFHVRHTPDISNYILRFDKDYPGHDVGFIFLAHFFRDHGATYYQFQNWFYLVAISCLAYGLIRLTSHRTLIYILYFIFPFLLNLVQLRNFMVMALLVLAIGVCYDNERKISKRIWWCVICGLAATQHIAALAYIPFAFIWDNKKILRFILICASVSVVLMFLIPGRLLSLITYVLRLIDSSRVDTYSAMATRLGFIVMVMQAAGMVLIAKFSAAFVDEYNLQYRKTGGIKFIENAHFNFVVNLLYYSSIFWPIYYLNGNYARLMQNEYLVVYMAIATLLQHALAINQRNGRNIKMSNMLVASFAIFIPLFIYSMMTIWVGLSSEVVAPILADLLN